MIIEKVIEDNVSLSTRELMSANIQQVILDKLRYKYEGHCWENAYIIRVIEIIKRSNIKMARDRLDGQGDTNAQFRVEAIIYPQGDVLTGCTINIINRYSNIVCEHEHAVVILKDNGYFLSPKVGQKITVMVQQSSYLTREEKVQIYSSPYTLDKRQVLYRIPALTSITDDQIKLLEISLGRVKSARAALDIVKKTSSESVKFFESTMYAYADTPDSILKKLKTPGYNLMDLESTARDMVSGKIKSIGKAGEHLAYMRHPSTNMATSKIYELTKGWESGVAKMITIKPQNVSDKSLIDLITDVLNEHSIYLNMIASMSQIYDKVDMRKQHANIWESYTKQKVPTP